MTLHMASQIRRHLGEMRLNMAQDLGYTYGWEDNLAEPRLTFYVFCCECDRAAAQILSREQSALNEEYQIRGVSSIKDFVEDRTLRIMAKDCPHIDAVLGYPEADRRITAAKYQEQRERQMERRGDEL